MTDVYKKALEAIATRYTEAECYDFDMVQALVRTAREALGWHWHVAFKDWRDSQVPAQRRDGSPITATLHLDIGVPALDDVLPLYKTERVALDAMTHVVKYYAGRSDGPVAGPAASVEDCHNADCPAFEKMARLVQAEVDRQRAATQARKDKALRDAEDERAWRAGTREKVK